MSRHIYGGNDGSAYLEYDAVLRETTGAKLYQIHNEEIWLPKSQIQDDNGELVVIPAWLASQKGLESDW